MNMLEFKNINNNEDSNPISIQFNKGFNVLKKDSFLPLLTLKDFSFKKGEIIYNDQIIYSAKEKITNKKLFGLKINSKVLDIFACFLFDGDEKNKTINEVISKLKDLKHLPLDNIEQKEAKISAIFSVFHSFKPIYLVLDFYDKINIENYEVINQFIKKEEENFIFIINENPKFCDDKAPLLDSSNLEDDNFNRPVTLFDLNAHSSEKNLPEIKNKPSFNFYKNFFKENFLVAVLIIFSISLTILFSSLCIYSFRNNVLFDRIIIIFVFVISFLVYCFAQISSFDFVLKDDKNSKKLFKLTLLMSLIYDILGCLMGTLFIYLFYENKFLIDPNKFVVNNDLLLSFIIAPFILIIPFIAKPFLKLYQLIKNKMSKK